jgi:hypothetical protein
MAHSPTRGAMAGLVKLTQEYKAAELELKRLECKTALLQATDAKAENAHRVAETIAERRAEVLKSREQGNQERERQESDRHTVVQSMHEAEKARKRNARQSMVQVFTAKVRAAREHKEGWRTSVQGLRGEASDEVAELKRTAQAERRSQRSRRQELICSMQRSRIDTKNDTVSASKMYRDVAEEQRSAEFDALHTRARTQREQSRQRAREAREAVAQRNTTDRENLVAKLSQAREDEIQRLRADAAKLSEEMQRLKAKGRS